MNRKKKETKQNKQDTWREKQCHENIADCYSSDKCCHCDLRLRVTQWDWRVSKLLRYDIDNSLIELSSAREFLYFLVWKILEAEYKEKKREDLCMVP